MSQLPYHLCYILNRRQRLIPHLAIWLPHLPLVAIIFVGSLLATILVSLWCLPLVFLSLWVFRGFLVGLLDVLVQPVRHMDLLIEEKGLGFLAGRERWWIFLDGFTEINRICQDTWTLRHFNGTVINIPVEAISDDQIEHLKSAAQRGREYRES